MASSPTLRSSPVIARRWRLDYPLGEGAYGATWAATHRLSGERAALKLLHPHLAAEPAALDGLAREAYVANRIRHPGIVPVHDEGVTEEGVHFLAFELVEGETLEARRLRAGGALPPGDVAGIGHDVANVLAAVHDAGVLHCDVKPANVMITREGRVRLLDFGLARLREPTGPAPAGCPIGTPSFMPPEQATGRVDLISERSDLWALGATLFTLASARGVRDIVSPAGVLVAAALHPVPRLLSLAPSVPPLLADIVDRALAFHPAQRFASARTMQAALAAARGATSLLAGNRSAEWNASG